APPDARDRQVPRRGDRRGGGPRGGAAVSLRAARRMEGIERTLIRRIFDAAPPDAIQLGLGQPDLVSPPSICLAGVQAIAEGRTGYTSTAGDPELRAAVAA